MGPATLPLGRGLLRPSLFRGAERGEAAADKPEAHLPPRVSPERKPGGGRGWQCGPTLRLADGRSRRRAVAKSPGFLAPAAGQMGL